MVSITAITRHLTKLVADRLRRGYAAVISLHGFLQADGQSAIIGGR